MSLTEVRTTAVTVGRVDEIPLREGRTTDVNVLVCPLHQDAFRWSDGAATAGAHAIRVFPARDQDGALVVEI